MPDLFRVLKRAKSRRAPGPDQLPVETLKLLPYFMKRSLLDCYNHSFSTCAAPSHWKLSKVVTLYKGNNNDSRAPSSYPLSNIALPPSIFSFWIGRRLLTPSVTLPSGRRFSATEFHFRQSTQLFLFTIFYHHGEFYVQDQFSNSATRSIGRGVRQGCLLSPYLFVILLSALTHDLHSVFQALFGFSPWTHSANLRMRMTQFLLPVLTWPCGCPAFCSILLFVLVFLLTLPSVSYLPSTATFQFQCHPPSLHSRPVPASTAPLPLHTLSTTIHCCHLSPLFSAKYLGSFITPTSSPTPDILFRCCQASTAFKQLEPYLRHPLTSQRQKLRTYSSIVQSILLHGMESQTFSPAQVSKIESLHYKAFRQILQIKEYSNPPTPNVPANIFRPYLTILCNFAISDPQLFSSLFNLRFTHQISWAYNRTSTFLWILINV